MGEKMTTQNKADVITEFLKNGQPRTLKEIRQYFKNQGQTLRSNNIKVLVAMQVIESVSIIDHATGKTSNGRKYKLRKN